MKNNHFKRLIIHSKKILTINEREKDLKEIIKKLKKHFANDSRIKDIPINVYYQLFVLLKDNPDFFPNIQGPLERRSAEEIESLVKEFLNNLNPEYLKHYNKLKSEKKIFYSEQEITTCVIRDNEIHLKSQLDITDGYKLVHEIGHTIQLKNIKTSESYSNIYREIFPIALELLFIDFLKLKGYKEIEINISKEQRTKTLLLDIAQEIILYILYNDLKNNRFNYNNFINQLNNLGITNEYIDYFIKSMNKALYLEKTIPNSHLYGTLIASVVRNNMTSQEGLIEILENLNTENDVNNYLKYNNLTEEEILNSILKEFSIYEEKSKII